MKKLISIFLILSGMLAAQEKQELPSLPKTPPPPEVVSKQLEQAQADFEIAQKMFNPWYGGPLLTPGAHNVPPGTFLIQPYLFVTNTFAQFNGNRKSVNTPDLWTVNPVFSMAMGWLSWLDFSVTGQGVYNNQSGKDSAYWGDTSLSWGIQLLDETPYKPAVRFVISETFPTGRYRKLNPDKGGIDGTGSGTFLTNFSLNVGKVFWWMSTHPFAWRLSMNYGVPTPLHVRGFNVYGGGFHTRGKIHPGNKIAIDTSIELSFTQKWVFALDLVYTYQNHSTFSGHKGRTKTNQTASVGTPSNDQLSCAPAIEYNASPNIGFLAGVWFTITGRNSADFVSGILSMYYVW